MQKFGLLSGLTMLFLFSCGEAKDGQVAVAETPSIQYDYRKLPERRQVNEKATEILNEWEAFQNLSRSFEIFYQARNEEDLMLAVDDLIQKEKELAGSEYPTLFNRTEIKSRQRVIKTFLLKTKADLDGNRNPTKSSVAVVEAYNIFRDQFNIITSNPIDTQQLLQQS